MQPTLAPLATLLALLVACDSGPASAPAQSEPAKTEPVVTPTAPANSDASPEPAKVEPAKVEPTNAAPTTAEPGFPLAVAGAPGPAFFAVDKIGVVALDESGFHILEGSPNSLQKDMQIGPDGKLYMIAYEDIYRLEGRRLVSVAKGGFAELGGSPDHLAVAANGDLWVTTFKGVSRWDGKAWTTEEKAKIGAGDDLLAAIAVDNDGRVWVASSNRVHMRNGETWQNIDLKKVKRGQLWLKDIERDPQGAIHVVTDDVVIKLKGFPTEIGKVPVGVRGFAQLSEIRFAPGGSIGLISYQDVYHVPAGGSPRKYSSEKSRDFTADRISAIAPDDSGRLWVGSDIGVVVIVPGGPRVEWLSGSVPELVGNVSEMVVFGAGPAKLPTGGPKITGGLTGKILKDGTPVANTTVELCPSPSTFFTRTPCADAPVKFSVKTDASGVWTVPDAPLGSYGLAVKNGKKWSITLMSDVGDGMKSGTVYDTGSISLEGK